MIYLNQFHNIILQSIRFVGKMALQSSISADGPLLDTISVPIEVEDYVVIPAIDQMSFGVVGVGESFDDEDSYDYCDDVCGSKRSVANPSVNDDDDDSSIVISVCSHSNGTRENRIILTVPFGLMKDLDEAHAAATLAQVPEFDVANDDPVSSTVESSTLQKPALVEEEEEDESKQDQTPSTQSSNEIANKIIDTSTDDCLHKKKKHMASTGKVAPSARNNINARVSRISNKKRRKKLKLMKKANGTSNMPSSASLTT